MQEHSEQFVFLEFNPVRAMRGAPAARVEADGMWLWMSERDLRANIKNYGEHPALMRALRAYREGVRVELDF